MVHWSEQKAIKDDPSAFFYRISVKEDSTFLLTLIEACTTKHWSALHASKIFSVVQHVCQNSENTLIGLKIFTACLKLVSWVELEDDERSYPAVVGALQAAQTIIQVIWRELEHATVTRSSELLSIVHQFVHCLVQLGLGDQYEHHFRDLINLSPVILVSMHLWIYARNSSIRYQANLDRLTLIFRDSSGGCYTPIKNYLDDADPEVLSNQLDVIIKASDIDEGSLVECFAFLMYLEEKHPARISLVLYDLEANFVLLLDRIVHSDGDYDVRIASVYQMNKLLEKLMEDSTTQIGCLHEILRVQDGASLMVDVALMITQSWSSERHTFRRPTLFFDSSHHQSPDPAVFNKLHLFLLPQILQILSNNSPVDPPDMPTLLSILSKSLRPVWHPALSQLRSMDANKHPGAPEVIKMWISLGWLVGVHKLVQPPVGCAWLHCPRFLKETNENMAVCTRCDCAQYCDEKCQKRDWKSHKRVCGPSTPS